MPVPLWDQQSHVLREGPREAMKGYDKSRYELAGKILATDVSLVNKTTKSYGM